MGTLTRSRRILAIQISFPALSVPVLIKGISCPSIFKLIYNLAVIITFILSSFLLFHSEEKIPALLR